MLACMKKSFFGIFVASVLVSLFCLPLQADNLFITNRGMAVRLEQHSSQETSLADQEQMKALFVESFAKCYRVSGAYTNLSDQEMQEFLESDFEKTLRPLLYPPPARVFLGAKVGERLVGYALFEQLSEDTIYVAESAVAPDFWGQGLGRKLTLYLAENNPLVRKVVLLTERINKVSQRFYEMTGFQPSSYMHEGYSVERFCAYEKVIR